MTERVRFDEAILSLVKQGKDTVTSLCVALGIAAELDGVKKVAASLNRLHKQGFVVRGLDSWRLRKPVPHV